MPLPYAIPALPPPDIDFESRAILKALNRARPALAELKGLARSVPNPGILIDTLSLQEAKASSEIENYVTTQDQVFQISPKRRAFEDPNQKEVARYRDALLCGFEGLQRQEGLLTNNTIIDMFQILKGTTGGFRPGLGTALRNEVTGETVYVPPQSQIEIQAHMAALEAYINAPVTNELDPLVQMAIIHHQFESIHPFPDGNGRLGRILNVLYLVQQGLLDTPILYLSRYITKNKAQYYGLLQSTRDASTWEDWVLFILDAVEQVAIETMRLVVGIRDSMANYKALLRDSFRKMYSQDLLNNLFRHPYTRIEYVMDDLKVSRQTASSYLNKLTKAGFLERLERGKDVYFVNVPLVDLFMDAFEE